MDRTLSELASRVTKILEGQYASVEDVLDLAHKLVARDAFAVAHRLLDHAWRSDSGAELGRLLAFCTYKDPGLPPKQRLDAALDVLRSVEDLNTTESQESLGLAGAICKRLWEVTGDRAHLEQSLGHYERGSKLGVARDAGYTSINTAFVLDLLVRLDEDEDRVNARRDEPKTIREELIESLEPEADQCVEELKLRQPPDGITDGAELAPDFSEKWWLLATVAEAHLGLGSCEAANKWLGYAKNLAFVPDWVYESTALQLASLARLHTARLLRVDARRHGVKGLVLLPDVRADVIRETGKGRPVILYREGRWWKYLLAFLLGVLLMLLVRACYPDFPVRRDVVVDTVVLSRCTVDLGVTMTANRDTLAVGNQLVYTTIVANTRGQANRVVATFALPVQLVVDSMGLPSDFAIDTWTVGPVSPSDTLELRVTAVSGIPQTDTVEVVVVVRDQNCVDANPGNNTVRDTIVVVAAGIVDTVIVDRPVRVDTVRLPVRVDVPGPATVDTVLGPQWSVEWRAQPRSELRADTVEMTAQIDATGVVDSASIEVFRVVLRNSEDSSNIVQDAKDALRQTVYDSLTEGQQYAPIQSVRIVQHRSIGRAELVESASFQTEPGIRDSASFSLRATLRPDGTVDPESVSFESSTNAALEKSVREWMINARFGWSVAGELPVAIAGSLVVRPRR